MEEAEGFLRVVKGQLEDYRVLDVIPLGESEIVLGRPPKSKRPDAECPDISILDDYVSRGHARICYERDKKCFAARERDGGTANGTFLNGKKMEAGKPYALADGDLIGIARVGSDYRVVLRFRESERTLGTASEPEAPVPSGLSVDLKARTVVISGREVRLRRKEFDLLAYLYENRGKACSKDEIAEVVWKEEEGIVSQETIDQNVHRIRKAIEPDPGSPRYLVTLPHYGYRINSCSEEADS